MLNNVRKKLTVFASALTLGVSAALAVTPAAAQETFTWKVQSHWPGASSSYKDSLGRLKEQLEERSDGRLKLQLFEAGSLFKAQETFNAVSRGILEMGTISPSYASDKMTLAGIASGLPFAFRNVWEAAYFHQALGFEEMLREEAAQHGVYWATDKVYPTEMVVKEPIESLEDFKSLKIRSSGALQKFLTEAGAAASYIPGGELYTALDSGIVDGAHWGAAQGAYSMALYEIAKYHVQPALNIAGTDVIIVSQKAMDKLPADLQQLVKDVLQEQFWYRTNEYLYKERITLAKAIAEEGVEVNTLPQDVQDHLVQVGQAMWDEEGKRSDKAAEALSMLKSFLSDLGYL
ncbi:TRAP transporter substrate-binding protein DctP [Marinobacter segnicrescens]|jgi:TRAP-type C4-dicarboxylate transport system substrate-binding protein|uniref:TRAP-type mannitol/chloroaromatic compound transport system, substrate-binding protein n=1 Tax=Marinobacter segnicrescens TaxID=430453 RepID=A0A1I0E8D5_9GAMM|nr:TRAP transporter substrate-binding protein DctP [Marinobacter segnicrescens]SET41247.1 TRAP-type mannitol/chloroaromatic compound transport system, substrate-binding protein [Marinobacter segnicrescens]